MRWLSFVILVVAVAAQAKPNTLHSKILNEDRTWRVRLPAGYEVSGEKYPVLYLLDGQTHFEHVAGSAGYLMDQGEIPQMIIVALDSTVRVRDFTPTDWPQAWIGGGGAAKFREFLSREFIPEIEKTLRTDGYRVLAGHSASGQFALYTLESEPQLFQGYIALSASLDWDNRLPARGLSAAFDKKPDLHAFAFVARCNDSGSALEDFNQLVEVFKTKAPSGLRWKSQAYDLETHGSVALVGMIDALRALYAGWRVPEDLTAKGLPAVEAYFATLSKTYGRPVPLTETVVNDLAYQALEKKQNADAIALFQRNVTAHPGSANALDGLADGLAADGQTAAAIVAQEKAVRLAKQSASPQLPQLEKHLKKLKASKPAAP
ncbi:MAG: alpha/beta hydrolase-fold protein [Archangium sp.]